MKWKHVPKICLRIPSKAFVSAFSCNTLDAKQNAFLDRFGKTVAVFDQNVEGDFVYAIVEESVLLMVLKHLKPYAAQSGIRIEVIYHPIIHVIDGELGRMRFPQNVGYLTITKNLPSEFPELPLEAYEQLRIEHNMPQQGVDFNHEMFLDLGLDCISFTKGCYLGQEVMARGEDLKPARKIVRILYKVVPDVVKSEGIPVGSITSSCKTRDGFLCFALAKKWDGVIDNGQLI